MGHQQSRVGTVRNDRRMSRIDQVERMSLKVLQLHKDLVVETSLFTVDEFSPLMDSLHDAVDATQHDPDARRRAKSVLEKVVDRNVLANSTRDDVEQAVAIVTRHVQQM
jgi:hypothetical protein